MNLSIELFMAVFGVVSAAFGFFEWRERRKISEAHEAAELRLAEIEARDKEEERQAEQARGFMGIVDKLLDTVTERFADLQRQTQARHEELIERILARQDESSTALVKTIAAHMTPVTQQREGKLAEIHADVQAGPGATVALIREGPGAEFLAAITALKESVADQIRDLERGLVEWAEAQGEQLTPALRAMWQQEARQYTTSTQRNLDNLTDLVQAVQRRLEEELAARREGPPPAPPRKQGGEKAGVPNETPEASIPARPRGARGEGETTTDEIAEEKQT